MTRPGDLRGTGHAIPPGAGAAALAQVVLDDVDLAATISRWPDGLDEDQFARGWRRLPPAKGRDGGRECRCAAKLAGPVANADLHACGSLVPISLDQLRVEGYASLGHTPGPWRWTTRQTIAEEHHWRASRAGASGAARASDGGTGWYPTHYRPPSWLEVEQVTPAEMPRCTGCDGRAARLTRTSPGAPTSTTARCRCGVRPGTSRPGESGAGANGGRGRRPGSSMPSSGCIGWCPATRCVPGVPLPPRWSSSCCSPWCAQLAAASPPTPHGPREWSNGGRHVVCGAQAFGAGTDRATNARNPGWTGQVGRSFCASRVRAHRPGHPLGSRSGQTLTLPLSCVGYAAAARLARTRRAILRPRRKDRHHE